MKKFLLFTLLIPLTIFAQERHHEMGMFAGSSNYIGDLQNKVFPNYGYKPVGGLMYKYFINPNVGFRFGASYTELGATDSLSNIKSNVQRNLSFATNLFEVQAGVEINLLKVDLTYRKFSPYIFGGISTFYFNPYTTNANDVKVFLKPLSTEGQGLQAYTDRKPYSLVNVAIPMGGGLKALVGKKVLISAEIGFRLAFTDYLDDVSKSYVNMDTLFAYKGQQSVELSYRGKELQPWDKNYPNQGYQRGDSHTHDWYWFAGLGMTIYFDSFGNLWPYRQTRCPKKKY